MILNQWVAKHFPMLQFSIQYEIEAAIFFFPYDSNFIGINEKTFVILAILHVAFGRE